MKRFLLILAGTVLLANLSVAQSTEQKKDPNAKPQDPAAAQAPAAAPAKPAGGTKTAPEPKTKEEEAAMQAVLAKGTDPTAMQAAADDFSTKFPDSNVRGMLYRAVMLGYQQKGEEDKAYEAGRKSLTFDGDDPLTLAVCSIYLASHTHDTDLDKNERLADAKKMANDAIANIDQLRMNNKAQQSEREQAQAFIKGDAYEALAIAAQASKDWASAETNYQKSAEASPDPATYARLGFAQRAQGKLQAALASFNKAIEMGNQSGATGVVQVAQQQKDQVEQQLKKQPAAPAAPKQ